MLEYLFKNVAGLEARKSIKRRLQRRCFPVNIAKFLRTIFSIEHIWWLLLEFSINLFRKATFWKKLIFQKAIFRITYFFWGAVFLEQLLFQKTLPPIAATFSEELLFYNTFSEELCFTATVPFHMYTSYLVVSNLVNSVPVKRSLSAGVLSCISIIAQSRIIGGKQTFSLELLFQKMLFLRTGNFGLLTSFSQLHFLFIV